MNRRVRRKKSRNNTTLIISMLLLVVIALSTLFFFTDVFDNVIKRTPKITEEVKSEQIDNGIKLQTETKESKTFTSFVAYPLTENENVDLSIHDWVTEQEDNFYEEMDNTEILLGKDFQAHFNIETDFTTINKDIMSFALYTEQLIETDNEYTTMNTFVVDLATDKVIHLTDLLNKRDIEKDGLYLIIKDKLSSNNKIDNNLLKEHLSNPDKIKWSLDEEQLTLYFNPGEISDDTNIIQVEIPLLDIYKFADDGEYEELVITEKVQEEIDKIAAEKEAERLEAEKKELETNKKYVALTFDDGPSGNVTPRILDTLSQYDAKATFYMLGQNAQQFPDIAKDVADAGHEIANHSITHANLNAVSAERVKKEMVESMDQIEEATGVKPATFRPPYGNYNQTVIDNAVESDQSIIMWSVDTLDWESRNANAILEKVRNQTRSGSIVLMHDIHATTADGLPQVMEYLSNEGYEFVTVSELMPLLEEDGIGPYYGK